MPELPDPHVDEDPDRTLTPEERAALRSAAAQTEAPLTIADSGLAEQTAEPTEIHEEQSGINRIQEQINQLETAPMIRVPLNDTEAADNSAKGTPEAPDNEAAKAARREAIMRESLEEAKQLLRNTASEIQRTPDSAFRFEQQKEAAVNELVPQLNRFADHPDGRALREIFQRMTEEVNRSHREANERRRNSQEHSDELNSVANGVSQLEAAQDTRAMDDVMEGLNRRAKGVAENVDEELQATGLGHQRLLDAFSDMNTVAQRILQDARTPDQRNLADMLSQTLQRGRVMLSRYMERESQTNDALRNTSTQMFLRVEQLLSSYTQAKFEQSKSQQA